MSYLNLFLRLYTWRVMLIVRAKNKWVCVATINGFRRIRCVILRGKVEAFVTNGRHGKIETFIARWNGWVRNHRLFLDRVVLQVLLELHVNHAGLFINRKRPCLYASTLIEAILRHWIVIDAYPSSFVIYALQEMNHVSYMKENMRVFNSNKSTYIFLNGHCISKR